MGKEIDLSDFASPRGYKCSFCSALPKLQVEQKEKIRAACNAPEISSAMIRRRLEEWSGMRVSKEAISRHRRKECGND